MTEDEIFFVGQKAFIKKGGEVLTLTETMGIDFPGGKIQVGETDLKESLKREVREETGLEVSVGDPFTSWIISSFPVGHKLYGKKLFIIGYRCAYISGEVRLSHEHSAYRWVNAQNYKDIDDKTAYFQFLQTYFDSNT